MQVKVALVFLMLVLLDGTIAAKAKKTASKCPGSKSAVCKQLAEKVKELEVCEEERDDLDKTIEEGSAENERLEQEIDRLTEENEKLVKQIEEGSAENERLEDEVDRLTEENELLQKAKDELEKLEERQEPANEANTQVPKNCLEVLKSGKKTPGLYNIDPDGQGSFFVYCDQIKAGGGWTVFQRRRGGWVPFDKDWKGYKKTFGMRGQGFWLGLDKIHRLTGQTPCDLRIELVDRDFNRSEAFYSGFSVGAESSEYKLSLGEFKGGEAGDSMSIHAGQKFTTKDRDNDLSPDSNCAITMNGGWWYNGAVRCADANLNGKFGKNVFYRSWRGTESLKRVVMAVRPSRSEE